LERQALVLEAQQAAVRVTKVSSSLNARFKEGAALTGQLDLANLPVTDEKSAVAVGQRLAIDLTVGAAQLDQTTAELAVARTDVTAAPGNTSATAKVAELEAKYIDQQKRLMEISAAVDEIASDGESAPLDVAAALPENSRDREASAAVANQSARLGATADTSQLMGELVEMARDEAKTGNSKAVNAVQGQVATILMGIIARTSARLAEGWRRLEEKHREWFRAYDKRTNEKVSIDRSRAVAREASMQFQRAIEQATAEGRAISEQRNRRNRAS
jgi:hypothetical protein